MLTPLIHENTEAQRGEVICPGPHSQEGTGLDLGSRTQVLITAFGVVRAASSDLVAGGQGSQAGQPGEGL